MVLNSKEISAIRLGTCGGIGLTPGTVVVTEQAVDGRLQPYLETVTLPIRPQRWSIFQGDGMVNVFF